MKKLNMMLALTIVLAVSASGAIASDIPWFDNTNGNPYTDGNGDMWAVHQVTNTGATYADWSNYVDMTWTGTMWDGCDTLYGHPTYRPGKYLTSTGYGARRGALTFAPGVSGKYSWTGDLFHALWSYTVASTVRFGKFDSNDAWTLLHTETMANSTTLDLDTVAALQNISVGTGEKLGVVISSAYGSAGVLYFAGSTANGRDPVGINLIPEPATLCLLAIGGIGMLARRRRRS